MNAQGDESLRSGLVGLSESERGDSAAGLVFSVILHGLALLSLLIVGVFGSEGSEGGLEIVPVEVELIHKSASMPMRQQSAALPKRMPLSHHLIRRRTESRHRRNRPAGTSWKPNLRLWQSCASQMRLRRARRMVPRGLTEWRRTTT